MVVFDVGKRIQQQMALSAVGFAALDLALQALCLARQFSGTWVQVTAIALLLWGY